jgi:phage shock protein PspC (stress-responsive transcriptional regulator)
VLGGVASGLGAYFGVDPLLFRVMFVVLTLAGGTGLVLYAALWILLPPATGAESVGQTVLRRPSARAWVGVALLGLAALLLSGAIGFQRPGIVWALALITIGVLLFRQEATGGPPPVGPSDPARPDQMGPGQTDRPGPAGGPPPGWGAPPPAGWGAPPPAGWGGGAAAAGWAPAPPAGSRPSPRTWGVPPPGGRGSRRPPSVLGLLTVAVAVLAVGVAALLDNLGAVEMTLGRSLALFLVVIGLGLVVGAWRGWSAGLVILGLLMVPTVAAASLADVPFRGGVGDRWIQPRSAAEIRPDYQLAFGRLTVDLHEVRFGEEPARIRAGVGMGEVVVYVPEGVPVEAHGRTGAGQVELFGRVEDGIQVELTQITAGSERAGRLRLDLSAGYGAVRVLRWPPPPGTPTPPIQPQIQEIG